MTFESPSQSREESFKAQRAEVEAGFAEAGIDENSRRNLAEWAKRKERNLTGEVKEALDNAS